MPSDYWTRFHRARVSRRTFLTGTATVSAGLATAALIGCSDDDEGGTTGGPATSPAAGQPKYGGTISIQTTNDAPHMDLHQTNSIFQAGSGAGLAYSRLFRLKIGAGGLPNQMTPEGDVVERVENPSPTVYIFHLRRGVKYHNIAPVNGRELIANDVIQSFQRQLAEKFNAEILADVASMTATDNYTLRFELTAPNADFLIQLADNRAPIIPHESWEMKGDLKEGPIIGSGAWIFDSRTPQLTQLKKNPEYFRTGFPYADVLRFPRIPDPNTAQAALRRGEISVLGNVNQQVADILRDTNAVFQESRLVSALGSNKIWVHNAKPPTQDARVRQAISKVIDRLAIIQAIEFGSGFLFAGVGVPDTSWFLPEAEFRQLFAVDVPGAQQLMSQAGVNSYNPSFFAGIKQLPSTIPTAELIKDQLSAININATIVPIDNIQLLNNAWGQAEWDMGFGTQQPQVSPTSNLEKFYKTGGSQNGYKVSDSQLDSLIAEQKTLVDKPAQRKEVFQKIQRRIIEQALLIPVYSGAGGVLVHPSLKNYVQSQENSRTELAWIE